MKAFVTFFALSCLPFASQAEIPNIALIRQDLLAILDKGFEGAIPSDEAWGELRCTVSVRHQLLSTAITIESEGEEMTFTLDHDSKVKEFDSNVRTAPRLSHRFFKVRKVGKTSTDPIQLEVVKTENNREYLVSIEVPDSSAYIFGRKTSTASCLVNY